MQKQIFKTPQIKAQKELRRKAKDCYRNIQRGKNEEVASGSKKPRKRTEIRRTVILSVYLALFTNPPFQMCSGAWASGLDLGRGTAKLVGAVLKKREAQLQR